MLSEVKEMTITKAEAVPKSIPKQSSNPYPSWQGHDIVTVNKAADLA